MLVGTIVFECLRHKSVEIKSELHTYSNSKGVYCDCSICGRRYIQTEKGLGHFYSDRALKVISIQFDKDYMKALGGN